MKKSKIFICIIILLIISIVVVDQTYILISAKETIGTSAKGMVVLEGGTNTILYGNNENTRMPMASTTKIITAILAIENCENIDEKIKISDKAVGIEGTSIYLKHGEELTMRELLYGLMLASGNDCAVAIAENFGGEEIFVNMMNDFAENLGLKNTNFDNPHGLDSDTHYTTAYDLAVMTAYALKNNIFREIVATERMVIPQNDIYQARYLKHKNKLLFTEENCIGVKTGFTDNAGRCLVNAHEEDGMMIISVVLNCQPMFDECKRLTDIALENYKMKEFVKPYNFVTNLEVEDSEKSEIGIITIKGFKIPILKTEENKYSVKYILPEKITAPIELNQKVGIVQVYYNDDVIFENELITIEEAKNNDIKYLFDEIIDKWF